ncbi:hypothetical protein EYF80_057788 [Liparis tanakae]|uniref:Uncharacterized protein n=1 Tax=Liparis tanakae TaxID=230148 RepID=A0A4Z2ET30_9TELE|nr:hypothetical protein EYF80_057788 [Liparis tanakae]
MSSDSAGESVPSWLRRRKKATDPGARVRLQLEVPLGGGTRETQSVRELWGGLDGMRNIRENTFKNNNARVCTDSTIQLSGVLRFRVKSGD